MEKSFWIFSAISFSVLISSLVFNACGILLLNSLRASGIAQTVIIINLSVSEMLIATGWIAELIAVSIGLTFEDRTMLVIWAIRAGVYCFWFADMYVLSIDRFLGCLFPLRHRALVNRKSVYRLITSLWIFCSLKSVMLLIFDTKYLHLIYNVYVWLTLDCMAVSIFSITYCSIFFYNLKRMRMRRIRTHSLESNQTQAGSTSLFAKVVGLIAASFMIFEVAPSAIERALFLKEIEITRLLEGWVSLCYQFILLVDPLIYIFLQRRHRRLLRAKARYVFRVAFRKKWRTAELSQKRDDNIDL